VLRDQKRNGPAINPATVEACAARLYSQTPVYDFHAFRNNGLLLHAPGQIQNATEKIKQVSFQIESWVERPYFILISGLAQQPRVEINGKRVECSGPNQFLEPAGQLILQVEGHPRIELRQ